MGVIRAGHRAGTWLGSIHNGARLRTRASRDTRSTGRESRRVPVRQLEQGPSCRGKPRSPRGCDRRRHLRGDPRAGGRVGRRPAPERDAGVRAERRPLSGFRGPEPPRRALPERHQRPGLRHGRVHRPRPRVRVRQGRARQDLHLRRAGRQGNRSREDQRSPPDRGPLQRGHPLRRRQHPGARLRP
jgi:hypothetical protein